MTLANVEPSVIFSHAVQSFFAGRIQEANQLCHSVLQCNPSHYDATRLLGVTFVQLGHHAAALPLLETAARARPEDPEGQLNVGATLFDLQRYDEALRSCDRALAIKYEHAGAHFLRGKILVRLRRFDEAVGSLAWATHFRPDFAEALDALARLLFDLGRFADALATFDRLVLLHPCCAETQADRGDVLYELRRYAEALESYDRAIAIEPDLPIARVQRGNILYLEGRFDDAVRDYDRALALSPSLPVALSNRANTLRELGRLDEALADLDAVLTRTPDDAVARFNRAHVLLTMGRLTEGFEDYEARKKVANRSYRSFVGPEWSRLTPGETVFVHAEQGLGDTIQFARFAQRLARMGADVVLEVQPELCRFLQSLDGVRVIKRGDPLPPFEAHIQTMSLPGALGVTLADVGQKPYLKAEAARVTTWGERLPQGRLRIGIAWQGSVHGLTDRGRSPALTAFEPLARCANVTLISLQKNTGLEQIDGCPFRHEIHTLGEDFDDDQDAFLDTAAIMEHLDLVITSDTSIAHVAGALGRPAWVALQHVPNWRWMMARDDTPWYPQTRLFRQQCPGDWTSVFDRIALALSEHASKTRSSFGTGLDG